MATKKKPTPAQLEARRLFAERARSGAFKKKKRAPRPNRVTKPGIAKRISAELKQSRKRNGVLLTDSKRGRNPLRFKSEKEFESWKARTGSTPKKRSAGRSSVRGRSKSTLKSLGRSVVRGLGMMHNPQGARRNSSQGLKRSQRKYKGTAKALYRSTTSGQVAKFRAASKQLARATHRGRYKRPARLSPSRLPNPAKNPRRRKPGYRSLLSAGASQRRVSSFFKPLAKRRRKAASRAFKMGDISGARSHARTAREYSGHLRFNKAKNPRRRSPVSGRRSIKNPSPAQVFSEFRGKDATTKSKTFAAGSGHITLAKLGALRELKVGGRRLKFGGGAALAADGRKKLHITGVKMNRPNPPGEVDYGEVSTVIYRADKPHIETGTFDYEHHFGEDGGRCPRLIVDAEGYPRLEGGSYKISADGIID